ncbi:hypothetical protein [Kitasatospora sp. NPDC098663]|uniref:hypothetical protein n=1 Tax=Kitasatospora sp. NPDC098663 TaxID=3364096 RepID=UPI00382C59B7
MLGEVATMAKAMPSEDDVPPGAERDLLLALHELYDKAGRPGVKRISEAVKSDDSFSDVVSHETVSKLLDGRAVPGWHKLRCVVTVLVRDAVVRPDLQTVLDQFHGLWLAAQPVHEKTEAGSDSQKLFDSAGGLSGRARWHIVDAPHGRTFFDVEPPESVEEPLGVVVNMGNLLGRQVYDLLLADTYATPELLARQLGQARGLLMLLLYSWAKLEDEMPERARARMARLREDWGYMGNEVIQDLIAPEEADEDVD